ncbi:hypothetical protein [Streptomyces sp. MMG1121]|uniref:hypothetical protein n=1 Tax=Streptomyces sp. MMG1121 TaxID=1415544 RepID=UPI000B1AF310|nr:hypothetical protein [Streptomyces sp. MMG1121]
MISRAVKALVVGATAATVSSIGCVAIASADGSGPTAPRTAATGMPSAVETFDYPGAARIQAERKIVLKRGDGHIVLTGCDAAYDIKVESRTADMFFCFKVSGKQGHLTMELPDAYGIWTEDHPVKATLTTDGKETVVNAPKNDYTPVGESGSTAKRSVLVELRVNS